MRKFLSWLIQENGMSWAVLIIVIAQSFHYYKFFIDIPLFTFNFVYAIFLTLVFSMPLLIFTIKLGTIKKRKLHLKEYNDRIKLYKDGVALYTWVDIIVNIYTWWESFKVIQDFKWNMVFAYIVITLFAILLPITLKKFAGEFKIKLNGIS